jgi:hypothetical protein
LIATDKIIKHIGGLIFDNTNLRVIENIKELKHFYLSALVSENERL